MATRRDRSSELRELARVLYRLMGEHEMAHTTRLKVRSPLSRILQHLPEWRAQRRRKATRPTRRISKDPSFFTVLDAANELNVPICAFAPTADHQVITDAQRELLMKFVRYLTDTFGRRDSTSNDFDVLEPFETLRKQAQKMAASPVGTDAQFEPEEADALQSIPGITRERLQVIRVRGNSMANRLHDGDRVLIDLQKRTPRNGEIIAVDRGILGRTIGYFRREGTRFYLDKENDLTIDLGSADDFIILGTITGIVWAPLRPRERAR
jgi:phage repressor protein C with HTH and peptisase S24 domain